ncbi:hypothetical protein BC826DRAFT_1159641 [Russula brevipes]|nr:hypothetical protein BC826DRAFT_1159641 [Russula brevipes]
MHHETASEPTRTNAWEQEEASNESDNTLERRETTILEEKEKEKKKGKDAKRGRGERAEFSISCQARKRERERDFGERGCRTRVHACRVRTVLSFSSPMDLFALSLKRKRPAMARSSRQATCIHDRRRDVDTLLGTAELARHPSAYSSTAATHPGGYGLPSPICERGTPVDLKVAIIIG